MQTDEQEDASSALEINEELPLVERVKRYCQSSVSVQRHVYVQELGACAEAIGTLETMRELVPLLRPVSCDPELQVRQALAEQLVRFAKVLLAEPDASCELEDGEELTAYDVVIQRCVPLLSGLLSSNGSQDLGPNSGAPQVLDAASEALIGMAGLLSPDAVGQTVLTAVLCLAHDNDAEENRVVATQLLGSLAPVVTSELCCQFVLPELVSLADDNVFRVRKAAALNVGALCAVVGEALTVGRLLPVYETLARDEIWGVRKASVESLAGVAAALPLELRTSQLVPLLQEFYADGSRWVRIAACQALGPFIATLPSPEISTELLTLFTQLANPSNPSASDSDISYYCAFNFPAVAHAVAASRWGELSEAFRTLAGNIQWKVRRTLSCALHELAAILGQALTEAELLPTFEHFLKDLDEVKVGVIQSVSKFLAVLSPAARTKYLPAIVDIRAETDNWRFRHMLALQLAEVGALFSREAVTDTLAPLALDLCTDPVAEVRIAAVSQVGDLLALLFKDEPLPLKPGCALLDFISTITGMGLTQSCYRRANCVSICSSLVGALNEDIVIEHLLPSLTPLAADPIPNVRLAVAKLVKDQLLASPTFRAQPAVQVMAETMRVDSDRDVLRAINDPGYVPPPYRSKPPPKPSAGLAALNDAVVSATWIAAGLEPLAGLSLSDSMGESTAAAAEDEEDEDAGADGSAGGSDSSSGGGGGDDACGDDGGSGVARGGGDAAIDGSRGAGAGEEDVADGAGASDAAEETVRG